MTHPVSDKNTYMPFLRILLVTWPKSKCFLNINHLVKLNEMNYKDSIGSYNAIMMHFAYLSNIFRIKLWEQTLTISTLIELTWFIYLKYIYQYISTLHVPYIIIFSISAFLRHKVHQNTALSSLYLSFFDEDATLPGIRLISHPVHPHLCLPSL